MPDGSRGPGSSVLDSRYAWMVVGVLTLAQTVSYIDRMIMGLLVGPIRKSFAISDTQFSLLAGLAFAIFYSIMGLPLGRLIDAGRRTRIISVAIAFWSVMTTLCGMASSFWSLFLARIGVGVGEAALAPAAFSIITDYFTKARLARALSIYMLGVTLGSGLAYIVGGWVVGQTEALGRIQLPLVGLREGWQLTFFLVGAPGVLAALAVLAIKEPDRRGLAGAAGEPPQAASIPQTLAFMWARIGAYAPHIFGMGLFIMAVASVNVWGPEYLIRTFGYTRPEAGKTFGVVMMLAGTAGLLTGGSLADWWFARGHANAYSRVILLSMAAMAPCMAAMAFATNPALGIMSIGSAVFFSAFQGGIAAGLIQLMTPNRMRGQAVAIYLMIANLMGMGLGPTAVASLTDFVFKNDAALNKSIALFGVVVIPLAALVMASGQTNIRRAVEAAKTWSGD